MECQSTAYELAMIWKTIWITNYREKFVTIENNRMTTANKPFISNQHNQYGALYPKGIETILQQYNDSDMNGIISCHSLEDICDIYH